MIESFPNGQKPGPSDWRMTVKCFSAGQPRPYADHIYRYQVFFEWISYDNRIKPEDRKWQPANWSEDVIKRKLKVVKFWYDKDERPADWSAPRLAQLVHVATGIWEFEVREAFID